jgi:8-oxo-dGTP pyrophosphatase MutT (NUDIX family)
MDFDYSLLGGLPSPFYRVAVKAIVFDDAQKLLIVINEEGQAEIPGGGWEHDETLEECLKRELQEEIGAEVIKISPVLFAFQGKSKHGWGVIRLITKVEVANNSFEPGDDMVSTKFVTQEEFLQLNFDPSDENIKNYTTLMWSSSKLE